MRHYHQFLALITAADINWNANHIRYRPRPYDYEAAARLRAERLARDIANHEKRYPKLKGGGE